MSYTLLRMNTEVFKSVFVDKAKGRTVQEKTKESAERTEYSS